MANTLITRCSVKWMFIYVIHQNILWNYQRNSMHLTAILYLTLRVKFVFACVFSISTFTRLAKFTPFVLYMHHSLVNLTVKTALKSTDFWLKLAPFFMAHGVFFSCRKCQNYWRCPSNMVLRLRCIKVRKLLLSRPHTHTHPFNGPLSGTTRVSRYQKGKTNLDITEARDSEWQWHQPGHTQVCTSLKRDNHANIPPLSFYRPDAHLAAQPTASKHWRQNPSRPMTSKFL